MRAASRQRRIASAVVARARRLPGFAGALLVGSVARGTEDRFSDVDLLLFVAPESFRAAWEARRMLRPPLVLASWDVVRDAGGAAAHKWIGPDLVMVECLIAEPSHVRLAEPFVQVAGSRELVSRLRRRPPIERSEMTRGRGHPIEVWFDRARWWARATFR